MHRDGVGRAGIAAGNLGRDRRRNDSGAAAAWVMRARWLRRREPLPAVLGREKNGVTSWKRRC